MNKAECKLKTSYTEIGRDILESIFVSNWDSARSSEMREYTLPNNNDGDDIFLGELPHLYCRSRLSGPITTMMSRRMIGEMVLRDFQSIGEIMRVGT